MINKIDKAFARLTKEGEKERERIQINKVGMKEGLSLPTLQKEKGL